MPDLRSGARRSSNAAIPTPISPNAPLVASTTRRHILEAAASCFERDGFHATTIPDICRKAGMSTGAIYTWFPSKGKIVASLAETAHARRQALLDQWSTPAELGDGLAALVDSLRGTSAPRPDVHLWSSALSDDMLREAALASFEQGIAGMADVTDDPMT